MAFKYHATGYCYCGKKAEWITSAGEERCDEHISLNKFSKLVVKAISFIVRAVYSS